MSKPIRTTPTSKSLIDHLISNSPSRISHTDVLPCPSISDHDAPYATINVRITEFVPRYKYIRSERKMNLSAFKQDFSALPLQVIYGVESPDDMVQSLNSLVKECIDRHAPLKRVKVTRPLGWQTLKFEIFNLNATHCKRKHTNLGNLKSGAHSDCCETA